MHEILRTDLAPLVDDVLRRLVTDIPLYAQLPDEELQGDIRRITERTLRAFSETFRTGVVPTGEALDPLRESATRRAEEGVPLEALLAAYHLGGKVCADHVAARFRPEELQDAIALNRLILDFLQRRLEPRAGQAGGALRLFDLGEAHGCLPRMIASRSAESRPSPRIPAQP